MSGAADIVLFETDARGVATITLNRPHIHNAFNDDVVQRLSAIWKDIAGRADVRVVVLKGAGRSFSAGGDLDWMRKSGQATPEQNRASTMAMARMLRSLNDLPQATLALVHGNCMAGGTGLASAADIVVATQDAKFALTEVRLGLTPATISPYVVAAIGARQARRYFLTGERFDAAEACRIGLVHEVVADAGALETRGAEVIAALLQGAPGAIRDSKILVERVARARVDEELMAFTAQNIADRRASPEGQEGLAAFFDKRKPNWAS
ncbi:MAG TPA: enoyl-CoA hydratase-related protein [Ferrovibrio sp.]|jgi:methylglutaconyl-CoA hydratase|uniref:enoyl-CoA hydratase-related protein n=1 Tax=Ferrovibrio sp. TaxID=1917215 RepID=UPI002B4B2719|nr:enoyl-CoA hydratase-related protein [Ferrovibrio sp.]HLT78312.1 enoyl-CoA hydratase-related protein [Ferrovibrio sp.]